MAFLEISGLCKNFGGACAVLDFDLSLEAGRKWALIGPNGAGKTTVLNLISGFYRPDVGRLEFDGQSLSGLPPHRIAMLGLSRTFQNIRLWDNLSVLDNVRLADRRRPSLLDTLLRNRRYVELERVSSLAALAMLETTGLAVYAGRKAGSLPYGLRRLVELARALASRPRLLLLDEPAAGLSASETRRLTELIDRLHKELGLTILMIEHRMEMVMDLCDGVTALDFGRIIASGRPEEIRQNQAVVEAYLGGRDA